MPIVRSGRDSGVRARVHAARDACGAVVALTVMAEPRGDAGVQCIQGGENGFNRYVAQRGAEILGENGVVVEGGGELGGGAIGHGEGVG